MLSIEELQSIIDETPIEELAETIDKQQSLKYVITELFPWGAIIIIMVLYVLYF